MKLTRKQELALIEIGLSVHLDKTLSLSNGTKRINKEVNSKTHKWSSSQRRKFAKSMKAKWDKKRKKSNTYIHNE